MLIWKSVRTHIVGLRQMQCQHFYQMHLSLGADGRQKNHYFYEVVNNKRTHVKAGNKGNIVGMQLALSGKNIPKSLKTICEKINKHYPSKRQYENWYWRIPFNVERVVIPYEMGEENIIKLLDAQFAELMNYEKELLKVMNTE